MLLIPDGRTEIVCELEVPFLGWFPKNHYRSSEAFAQLTPLLQRWAKLYPDKTHSYGWYDDIEAFQGWRPAEPHFSCFLVKQI